MTSSKSKSHKSAAAKKLSKHQSKMTRWYAAGAVAVLTITTTIWATLGAILQQGNADQLANTYLFEHWNTFQAATLSSAHSFLIKWPLFFLIHLIGPSNVNFVALTVVITLITVMSLAYIVYRIDKRPLIFGSLMLALASVLLMIPPEPAAGGLLPVNMAMLATRNLEYVMYIGGLVLMLRSKKFTDRHFRYGVGIMALLVASDKLFLFLSLGAALVALIIYVCLRRGVLARLMLKWFILAGLAAVIAFVTLWVVNLIGLIHLSSQANGGPFSLIHNSRSLVLGIIFAGLGLLTNFGANPAFDTGVLAHLLSTLRQRLISFETISYMVNLVFFGLVAYLAIRFLLDSFKHSKSKKTQTDTANGLSLLLLWSTMAAIGAFIVTDHYYAADARYLGISLFALVITAATYIRNHKITLTKKMAKIVPAVLIISVIISLITAIGTYRTDKTALADINTRNSLVAAVITQHPVSVLVGDYWRVLPIRQMSTKPLRVMPMSNCTQPRQVLSSLDWQPDLTQHSFAYLLSLDKGLTDYPACSLAQVLSAYGNPNASQLISGTRNNPRELLLFYDDGIHRSNPLITVTTVNSLVTITPIKLSQLPYLACNNGQTIMNIVAHEDDDLLFMNPAISHDIAAGDCVRTVYLTAGDAGQSQLYWLSREQGSQAAYGYMDGRTKNIWIQRIVTLSDHSFITVVNPRGNNKVSLIFFHLPDGNINGRGFKATHNESLAKLEAGKESTITSVSGQSTYTSSELINAIVELMQAYQPAEINTQATFSPGKLYTEHSDHMAVGNYTKQAYGLYMKPSVPINYFYGYPIRTMPQNVTGQDLADKLVAFLNYVNLANDTGCATSNSCLEMPTYGSYLKRQYSYTLPN